MNRTEGRIELPHNPKDVMNLATDIFAKHQDDGESSPLLNLDGIDWAVIGPTIPTAQNLHKQAENLKRQMEEAYRERDIYLTAIEEAVKASRNLLKAHNQKNPKRLGEWGFDVADSTPVPKPPKAK